MRSAVSTSALNAASRRSSYGSERTYCLTGTSGNTRSTRWAAPLAMRLPQQLDNPAASPDSPLGVALGGGSGSPIMKPKIVGHPNVAAAYLRASTDEQRLSPEAQRACIQAWAIRKNARVAAWYADRRVWSVAPIADRPALRAALAALGRHRAGLLVVAKRDRIARDVVLAVEVERAAVSAGARLALVTRASDLWRPLTGVTR